MLSQWGIVQLKRSLLLLLTSSLFSLLLAVEVTIVAEKSMDSEQKQVSALHGSPPTKNESNSSAQWELLPGKNGKKQFSDVPARKLLKRERKPKDLQTNSSSPISAEQTDTNLTGKLKVFITTLTNTFSAMDPVAINFTIVNEGENKARILKWFIPKNSVPADVLQENTFSIKYSGSSMNSQQPQSMSQTNGRLPGAYVGANYKRASPTNGDYQVLNPRETYSVTLNLDDFYSFSRDGSYTVVYDASNNQLFSETGGKREFARLTSNTLQLTVAGRFKPSYVANLAVNALIGSAKNEFTGCTSEQQTLIITARRDALACSTYVNDTYMAFFNPSNTNTRYTEWFGLDTLSVNVNTVKTNFAAIKDVFRTADMRFNCICTDPGLYAYVFTSDPYMIYLCGAFWPAAAKGYDSKMGTLVHEVSHFDIVANTDDVVYFQDNCRKLALSDPSAAVRNADSHEFFCESPVLADAKPVAKPVSKPIRKPVVNPTQGTSGGCSRIEENIDYVANDIGSALSASAEGCCSICSKFSGCQAFAWSNFNGGTCWLKSGKGSTIVKSGVRSAVLSPSICTPIQEHTDYVGNLIGQAPSVTAVGCCSICNSFTGCKAYTWTTTNGGTCWLKSGKGSTVTSIGSRSAVLGSSYCATMVNNVDYWGNDIATASSTSADGCCLICKNTNGCKAFTWNSFTKTCWLKSTKNTGTVYNGAVAGTIYF